MPWIRKVGMGLCSSLGGSRSRIVEKTRKKSAEKTALSTEWWKEAIVRLWRSQGWVLQEDVTQDRKSKRTSM